LKRKNSFAFASIPAILNSNGRKSARLTTIPIDEIGIPARDKATNTANRFRDALLPELRITTDGFQLQTEMPYLRLLPQLQ
jgi:hypothetical protein